MFNRLCNFIDLQLLSNVESINTETQTVTLKAGQEFDRINSEKTPDWNEPPSRQDPGTLFTQTFRIVADKLSQPIISRYQVNIPVVAILYDDNGKHIMGDFDQLCRITRIPTTDKDSLQLSRQTTTPIY